VKRLYYISGGSEASLEECGRVLIEAGYVLEGTLGFYRNDAETGEWEITAYLTLKEYKAVETARILSVAITPV